MLAILICVKKLFCLPYIEKNPFLIACLKKGLRRQMSLLKKVFFFSYGERHRFATALEIAFHLSLIKWD